MSTGRKTDRFFAGWKTIGKIAAGGTGLTIEDALQDYIDNSLPDEAAEHYDYRKFGFGPFLAEVQIWTIIWNNEVPLHNIEFAPDLLRPDYQLDRHIGYRLVLCQPKGSRWSFGDPGRMGFTFVAETYNGEG